MLPPALRNLVELVMLEGKGEPVIWPEGVNLQVAYIAIMKFFNQDTQEYEGSISGSSQHHVAQPRAPAPVPVIALEMFSKLRDCLELEETGERVLFPEGFTSLTAKQTIGEYISSNPI